MKARALIADDAALARRALRALLADEPWIECVGEARNGPETVAAIDRLRPDVVFLDIEMPGVDGLEVLRRVEHLPGVVFTTAYDRYAVEAFELEALDYLLKPFSERRFRQTLARLRGILEEAPPGPAHAVGAAPSRRLFVRERGRVVPLRVETVTRLAAEGDYVRAYVGDGSHLVSARLKELQARLDPRRFARIHRSHLVNLDYVAAVEPAGDGRLVVVMRDGARLVASRRLSPPLRRRLLPPR